MTNFIHLPFSSPFGISAVRGDIGGVSTVNKFGFNADVAAGDGIWVPSTAFPNPSSLSAGVITIVSGDIKDDGDPVGVGARTVEVQGLDANWALQTETFTLDGTTNVVSTSEWLRVFRVKVVTAGSENDNAGAITVTLGGTTIAQIAAGRNQTEQAWYTVPAGKTALVTAMKISYSRVAAASRSAEFDLMVNASAASNVWQPQTSIAVSSSGSSNVVRHFSSPIAISEKLDVAMVCSAITAADAIHGGFDLVLIENDGE